MARCALCLFFIFCCLIIIQGREVKRQTNFVTLGCMGTFDKHKFNVVSRICEDCFKLYREPEVLRGCKSNCFKNSYFPRCVEALLRTEELENLQTFVEELYE
ncbi:crustacean hyperglycemic hormone-like [Centruroides sculpturatus]|uniref:crustacean hyperglycemic hormone-like n=1 Tax=Centruroides sculpturatus TaxID=218467 RepID=UPI000C6E210E|nr:crustacean hyperglycemic hormone-like [Centruroides sculpturatus]XP_023221288.1 crustacean hyperglycemic hormone-like [Centruroides sculpturatus]XP_023221290.1 crustacean hyperglycemic hormone-like [Centruroides sculpturatus]